jgi:serine/threonine protein kinase
MTRQTDGLGMLSAGQLVSGRYEVQRRISEGERRRTYLAYDNKMRRPVALSVLRPECAHLDPEGVEREGTVLGRVGTHDNIVSVFDFDRDGSVQFVVFEYLGGGTLAELIIREGSLPPEQLLRLSRQVCRGLAHLHNKGLLHRDVCAKNVLLDERGNAHLGDFDSAIWLDDPDPDLPSTPNPYSAPESKGMRASRDRRSDLYSLGCLLYVMALGTVEVGGLRQLREARRDLPSSFADLVECLLADDPDGRPDDADQVLRWLDDIRKASNLDALIRAGESQQVEFKASLHHPYGSVPSAGAEEGMRRKLWLEVTKTIAAFLNSDGGILLIGVDDQGRILGVESDLPYVKKHTLDSWLLSLQQVIVNDLGTDVFSSIRISLVPHGDVHVAVISCPKRSVETWLGTTGHEAFYVRAGNGTRELTGSRLITYIREHFHS